MKGGHSEGSCSTADRTLPDIGRVAGEAALEMKEGIVASWPVGGWLSRKRYSGCAGKNETEDPSNLYLPSELWSLIIFGCGGGGK
jgi:hypothetical protein